MSGTKNKSTYELFFEGFTLKIEPKSREVTCNLSDTKSVFKYFEQKYDVKSKYESSNDDERVIVKNLPDHIVDFEFKRQYGYPMPLVEKAGIIANIFYALGFLIRLLKP